MRHGKIARLQEDIREELNQRLEDGETSGRILQWLNGNERVLGVLAAHFGRRQISEQNLSEWRRGGFVEWRTRGELARGAMQMRTELQEVAKGEAGKTLDEMTELMEFAVAVRYMKLLQEADGEVDEKFEAKLRVMKAVSRDVAQMRKGILERGKLELARERFEHQKRMEESKGARTSGSKPKKSVSIKVNQGESGSGERTPVKDVKERVGSNAEEDAKGGGGRGNESESNQIKVKPGRANSTGNNRARASGKHDGTMASPEDDEEGQAFDT